MHLKFGTDSEPIIDDSSLSWLVKMTLVPLVEPICTTIFYSTRLWEPSAEWIGSGSAAVVAIWIVKLFVSSLWVGRFQFGPMEWCGEV